MLWSRNCEYHADTIYSIRKPRERKPILVQRLAYPPAFEPRPLPGIHALLDAWTSMAAVLFIVLTLAFAPSALKEAVSNR